VRQQVHALPAAVLIASSAVEFPQFPQLALPPRALERGNEGAAGGRSARTEAPARPVL